MRSPSAILLCTLLGTALDAGSASANQCTDHKPFAKKLAEHAARLCEKDGARWKSCDPKKGNVLNLLDALTTIWKLSSSALGPRYLQFKQTDGGEIVNPGTRTWGSVGPLAAAATISITHRSGNADMNVTYCTVDADGNIELLHMERTRAGTSIPARTFGPDRVGGRFVLITLDGSGGIGKRYEYGIRLEGEMLK